MCNSFTAQQKELLFKWLKAQTYHLPGNEVDPDDHYLSVNEMKRYLVDAIDKITMGEDPCLSQFNTTRTL